MKSLIRFEITSENWKTFSHEASEDAETVVRRNLGIDPSVDVRVLQTTAVGED